MKQYRADLEKKKAEGALTPEEVIELSSLRQESRSKISLRISIGLLACFITIAVLGFALRFALSDVQQAVNTAEDSEQARVERSERADCIRDYQIDLDLVVSDIVDAAVRGDEFGLSALIGPLGEAKKNLRAVQDETLCPPPATE